MEKNEFRKQYKLVGMYILCKKKKFGTVFKYGNHGIYQNTMIQNSYTNKKYQKLSLHAVSWSSLKYITI